MDNIQAKEKFAAALMRPEENESYTTTILYMVYKTIEANRNITLNQLRWALGAEFLIKDEVIEGAVASLTSKSLFGCVSRYQPPKAKLNQLRNSAPPVHLRCHQDQPQDFRRWLDKLLDNHQELLLFTPPTFSTHEASTVAHVM